MATSGPRSCTCWRCPFFASQHRCSHFPTSPIPVPAQGCSLIASRHPLPSAAPRKLLPAVTHSLGLLPACKPPCLFPLPDVANCCAWSRRRWGYSLLASRHRSSLSQRLPIPVHRRTLAGATPSCKTPSPEMADSWPWLRLPHAREPASLFPLPEMAHSWPRSCTPWRCSQTTSRHPSPRCPVATFCPQARTHWGCFPLCQPVSLFPLPVLAAQRWRPP